MEEERKTEKREGGGVRETGDEGEGGRERGWEGEREGGWTRHTLGSSRPRTGFHSYLPSLVTAQTRTRHPLPTPTLPPSRLRNTTVILVNFRGGLSTHHDNSDLVSYIIFKIHLLIPLSVPPTALVDSLTSLPMIPVALIQTFCPASTPRQLPGPRLSLRCTFFWRLTTCMTSPNGDVLTAASSTCDLISEACDPDPPGPDLNALRNYSEPVRDLL